MLRAEYLGLVFGASEVALNLRKRARRANARSHDAGTLSLVWLAIGVGASIFVERRLELGHFSGGRAVNAMVLTLLSGGILLRWWAVLVLGRFFTVDVAIHEGHQVVTRGPYALVRHPSYTGALLVFVAIGLTYGSWPALGALVVPIVAALVLRIRVEERALESALGDAWRSYAAQTARLLFAW